MPAGSIFGFLVARGSYDSALYAPLFVAMSFSFGLAIFILVLMAACGQSRIALGDATVQRLKALLVVFVAAVMYFVLLHHLTNLYYTRRHEIERFILLEGGIYTVLFWAGQVLVGGIVPLALLFHPAWSRSRRVIVVAAVCVIAGGLAQMYVIIIGGQAYPLDIFPGKEVSSTFFDGAIAPYSPSLPELALGLGGAALALALTAVALRVLPFLPGSLADDGIPAGGAAPAGKAQPASA